MEDNPDKSRSFDKEYRSYNNDFDKSRSFDDEYFNDPNSNKFLNEPRSFSNDLMYSQNYNQLKPNYGSRLYDHGVVYDIPRKRSPVTEAFINNRSRDGSPSGVFNPMTRSMEQERVYKQEKSPARDYLPLNLDLSPGSDFDGNLPDFDIGNDQINEDMIKEAELVTEFLYGKKYKTEAFLTQRGRDVRKIVPPAGTPSSGSCTASSCDFWPHCGMNMIQSKSSGSINLINCSNSCNNKNGDLNLVSVDGAAVQRQNNELFIKTNNENLVNKKLIKKPPVNNRNNNSIVFFGEREREMPITRERESNRSLKGDLKRPVDKHVENIINSDVKILSNPANNQGKIRTQILRPVLAPVKKKTAAKCKSRSLPRSFMRNSCSTNEDSKLPHLFSPQKPLQIRAVSSPSLSENPLDSKKINQINRQNSRGGETSNPNEENNQNVSVLQKFKKTLSQLKGKPPPANTSEAIETTTKHRFGPLVWRSSKERRKTKHHRRDKCNSGDSGIQVELENEELLNDGSDSMENSPKSLNIKVRRANSAKVTNSFKLKAQRKEFEVERRDTLGTVSNKIQGRSLSQPSGLDRLTKENEESDTESVSSQPDVNENLVNQIYAEVLYPFEPASQQELRLEPGALIEIIRQEPGPWWWGQTKHDAVLTNSNPIDIEEGWFPKEFVRIVQSFTQSSKNSNRPIFETKICDIRFVNEQQLKSVPVSMSSSSTTSQQNSELFRENIIRELLDTEINYVKLLSSLCSGFLKELKLRSDVFLNESVNMIFSNIDQIYNFQQTFLNALRIAVDEHRIAECFLEHQSGFMVYSAYCNSYPRALVELGSLTGNEDAINVLESCRIAQNLPELPLSAHLLAPIQRICRYPLHLCELVKHSISRQDLLFNKRNELETVADLNSIDCKENFEMALNAMKRVTEMVNEGKRHSEYLSRIQARFDNFQGPPINIHSSRLFLQTDAIRMSPNLWNNTYTLFLFDRQLIYCKKDLLKRTHYIYKGRIFLDNCRILNLPDGRMFGVTLKNALRVYCDTRNKWFDFCFRSSSSKLRFLNTLSAERQFCGQSLFVSELAGNGMDEDNYSDREYNAEKLELGEIIAEYDRNEISERGIDIENVVNSEVTEITQKYNSDTLPKKSRKISKELQQIAPSYEINTNSLGRRKIGNWFRKAKSTNSTPSQSPTHHPLASSTIHNSDSSSQSSPGIGYRSTNKSKIKDGIVTTS